MPNKPTHETKMHGSITFPYAVYKVKIPEYMRSFPLHWHDEMEIIYIKSGRGTITVQSNRYEVYENDIVIVLPQTVHSIEQSNDAHMEYYNILFNFSLLNYSETDLCYEKYFKPLYSHTKQPPTVAKSKSELNRALSKNISFLIDARKTADCELMIKSNLFEMIHTINSFAKSANRSDLSLKNNYNKLKNLLVLIHSEYGREITVDEAAKICRYSPSHFMKLFKELTGKSFTRYLIDYRLEIAAEQIATTKSKIIDIAANVGFDNTSYFTRAFSDKYGMTPSEYKKSRQGVTSDP